MPPFGSGFMDRQIEEQVLRLQAHHVVLVAGKRKVDGTTGDVLAHGRAILELEPEKREDAAHAALRELGTGGS